MQKAALDVENEEFDNLEFLEDNELIGDYGGNTISDSEDQESIASGIRNSLRDDEREVAVHENGNGPGNPVPHANCCGAYP